MNEIASQSRQNAFGTPQTGRKQAPRRCKWCRGAIRGMRPDAKYCSAAHRLAAWRAQHDPGHAPERPDKRKRRGTGISIYVNKREMAELAEGRIPESVVAKVKAKLKPPEPLKGQLDILTQLREHEGKT